MGAMLAVVALRTTIALTVAPREASEAIGVARIAVGRIDEVAGPTLASVGFIVLVVVVGAVVIAVGTVEKGFIWLLVGAALAMGAPSVAGLALRGTGQAEGPTLIHAGPTVRHTKVSLIVEVVASCTGSAVLQGCTGCTPNNALGNKDEQIIDPS